jgi:hypothetical protein
MQKAESNEIVNFCDFVLESTRIGIAIFDYIYPSWFRKKIPFKSADFDYFTKMSPCGGGGTKLKLD